MGTSQRTVQCRRVSQVNVCPVKAGGHIEMSLQPLKLGTFFYKNVVNSSDYVVLNGRD
jgi:hypothetical protein